MKTKFFKILLNIFDINYIYRKTILFSTDLILIIISLNIWISSLNIGSQINYLEKKDLFLFTSLSTIVIYLISFQYKNLTRYIGSLFLYKLSIRNF